MSDTPLIAKINSLPPDLQEEVAMLVDKLLEQVKGNKKPPKRQFGLMKGRIKMMPNFDESVDDFGG